MSVNKTKFEFLFLLGTYILVGEGGRKEINN